LENIHKIQGPALLLAGPGTGKTYTLGLRLKYLIDEIDVSPDNITVITFTAEAAKNMRARISDPEKEELFLPYKRQPSNILTMHSLGFRLIRSYPDKVKLEKSIRLILDLEKSILLGDAAQLSGRERSLGKKVAVCRQFGDCKPVDEPKCQVCETYKNILRKCSSLDYDEQILLAVELLEEYTEICNECRKFTRHLLVDEYQDINSAQFKLIQLLSKGQEDGLFVVGDDDQSIYSWRGGSPKYIREFSKYFGGDSKVIPLNKSYRCHRNILEGSLKVVETFDSDRLQKEAFDYKVDEGPKIKVHNTPSDKKEAIIVRKIVQSALPFQDVLILVPQRQFAESVMNELRSNQINFTMRPDVPEIGLPLISRLNDWLNKPSDNVAFRRCLESFMDRIDSPVPTRKVKKAEKIHEREDAFSQIAFLWQKVLSGEIDSLWGSLGDAYKDNDFYRPLWEAFNLLLQQYQNKGDIREFLKILATTLSPWRGIEQFLADVTAWVDSIGYSGMGADSVRIMTFQGAKGLEAKVVCVLGLEEGIIPREDSDIPEQSRLLFVSMTRAINDLHLFHARLRSSQVLMRNVFPDGRPNIQQSRFIEAISDEYSEMVYHKA
jgi:DNA helicase-2/ATP-dependent DNA helicase PcrA